MTEWLILYADGSRFSSRDGEPWQAPRNGVQFVIVEDPDVGTRAESSPIGHWGWNDGQWVGYEDMGGYYDYEWFHGLASESAPLIVTLTGRMTKSADWEAMIRHASEVIMGIEKHGWREYERRP